MDTAVSAPSWRTNKNRQFKGEYETEWPPPFMAMNACPGTHLA